MMFKGSLSKRPFSFKSVRIAVLLVFIIFVGIYGNRAANNRRELLAEQEAMDGRIRAELLDALKGNDFSSFREFVFYVRENLSPEHMDEIRHNVLFYRGMVSESIEV